jgi:hypothetical protein
VTFPHISCGSSGLNLRLEHASLNRWYHHRCISSKFGSYTSTKNIVVDRIPPLYAVGSQAYPMGRDLVKLMWIYALFDQFCLVYM